MIKNKKVGQVQKDHKKIGWLMNSQREYAGLLERIVNYRRERLEKQWRRVTNKQTVI